MELTKREVQKRVLKDGKPLDLKLFEWDKVTRTFKSDVFGLVIDFTDVDNVHFKTKSNCTFVTGNSCTFETWDICVFKTKSNCKFVTGSLCTFKTGSICTFKTRNSCTFDTGARCSFITRSNCTFDTGSDCKFDTCNECIFITAHSCNFLVGHKCVIINKIHNEVIKPKSGVKLTICPLFTPGYLIESDYYVNGIKQDGRYMLADGVLSKIISRIGDVYKVYNYTNYSDVFSERPTYIVQDGDIFSHGETIEEARESLIYKISNRDKSTYDNLKLYSVLSKEEAIRMYRVITGACEFGVRDYVTSLTNVKDLYTVREIIEITNGLYGNDELRRFFKI